MGEELHDFAPDGWVGISDELEDLAVRLHLSQDLLVFCAF